MTVRVRVQNSDLRGLDARAMTNSVGMLGRAGLVASCLAADVGKYISKDGGRCRERMEYPSPSQCHGYGPSWKVFGPDGYYILHINSIRVD